MSDEQVMAECLTLYVAGHETTATALTWTYTVFATKYNTGGADYAEAVQASPSKEAYVPGEVFVIDPASPSAFALSREPYSMRVAGVYSTHPGIFAEGEPQRIPSKSLKI